MKITDVELVNRVTRECIKFGLSVVDGYEDDEWVYIVITNKGFNIG